MTNTETTPLRPADVFLHLIVTFLTPMFLATAGGDVACARAAATETVNAYAARHQADLLPIAQIIALGLGVLSSISLSMTENLSVPLILRLRANAASLNRAAEQCRRARRTDAAPYQPGFDQEDERQREESASAEVVRAEQRLAKVQASLRAQEPPAAPAPVTAEPLPPAPAIQARHASQPAATAPRRSTTASFPGARKQAEEPARPPMTEDEHRAAWAATMTDVARECTAGLGNLPPAERKAASMRAAILGSVAHQLLSGAPVPASPAAFITPGAPPRTRP